MVLPIESGQAGSDSESYMSVADWKLYAEKQGYDYEALDASEDEDIETALRRGTNAIDARVRGRLNGAYPYTTTQALLFPIANGVDAYGNAIAYDSVPRQIVLATAEATWRELQTPGSMAPDVAAGSRVMKRVKAEGTEVEWAVMGGPTATFNTIDNILAGLFGARSIYSGVAVRA